MRNKRDPIRFWSLLGSLVFTFAVWYVILRIAFWAADTGKAGVLLP